jgi:hypothetical protein
MNFYLVLLRGVYPRSSPPDGRGVKRPFRVVMGFAAVRRLHVHLPNGASPNLHVSPCPAPGPTILQVQQPLRGLSSNSRHLIPKSHLHSNRKEPLSGCSGKSTQKRHLGCHQGGTFPGGLPERHYNLAQRSQFWAKMRFRVHPISSALL